MLSRPFRLTRLELRLAVGAIVFVVLAYGLCSRLLFYLDREPVTLPVPEISEATEASVQAFNAQLHAAIVQGAPLKTSLTSNELNAWLRLSTVEPLRLIGEHSWLQIEGDAVRATISLPLEIVGRPGRYFSADGVLTGSVENNRCALRIANLHSRSFSSQGVAWLIKTLYRDSLPELLRLEMLIPEAFLQRCAVRIANSSIEVTCSERK
jgi:hypothetical protein